MQRWSIKEREELSKVTSVLRPLIKGGITVGLSGTLGAGKTTLVGELLPGGHVSSPTYVLCHEYSLENLIVEHWDLYRLKTLPEELEEPPPGTTCRVIEWWEKFPEISPDFTVHIELQGEYREITLSRRT